MTGWQEWTYSTARINIINYHQTDKVRFVTNKNGLFKKKKCFQTTKNDYKKEFLT